MSGSSRTTSADDFNCESNGLNMKEEKSSRDEFRDELLPEIRLFEAPLFIHDTEIEIKYEAVDYNNYNSTPALNFSETACDLDFETISKGRTDFSLSAIHIQNEMNVNEEMSSRDESGDEFVPEIRMSEAPLFIHDTEIEIKYEDVDYKNKSIPDLDAETGCDLDFETISKTRAELSSTAIHIQNEVDEGIVKMECSEEDEEMESDSKPDFELGGSESGPDYCPTSTSTHFAQNMHRQSLQDNDALHGSIISEARKIIDQFKCSDCGKSLTTKAHLTVHMRSHTGERPYTCEECEKSFFTKNALTRHKMIHSGKKPYTFEHCPKSFVRPGDLTSHTRTHLHTKCEQCEKSFSTKNNLTTHMRIHTGLKPHECTLCEKNFARACDLTRHKRIHTGERPYKCNACDKSFSQNSSLTTHMRIHTGEKPFECDLCHKCFTASGTLDAHTRAHTD